LTSQRKQASAAAAVTLVNIAVAVAVNLVTSGWSWVVFAVLAALSAVWVGLSVWQATPRHTAVKSLGAPIATSTFVARPELTGRIVHSLLAGRSGRVGITTGLFGAGGFGKTTLAAEVCALDEVKAAFDPIYWITVGQEVSGAALADTINDVIKRIDGQSPGFTRPEQAGLHLGSLLKDRGRSLLVVDDIWTAEQLRPFLDAGRGCTLLVTTRIPDLLPADVVPVQVDQMNQQQARDLVTSGVDGVPDAIRERLLEITGRWPLALSLTNGALRRALRDGTDVTETAEWLLRRLRDLGPAALDVTDAARRDRAVGVTLESSLGLLAGRRDRVVELAIYPGDTDIPRNLIALLWQRTAGLTQDDTDQLCQELVELSLVTRPADRSHLRLHDVIRDYLRHECGPERLTELHDTFLHAVAATLPEQPRQPVPWWTMPISDRYLWRNIAYHLTGARRTGELAELVEVPRWVIDKLRWFGPVAIAEDVAQISTEHSRELSRFLDQLGHLLVPAAADHAVVNALAVRLARYPALRELREAAVEEGRTTPRLVPRRPLPDLPDPALSRVLVGHGGTVSAGAFSPTDNWFASVSYDKTIRVWHTETGRLLHVLGYDSKYTSECAISPDGRWLATNSATSAVDVWDTSTWQVHTTLRGHRDWVNCFDFTSDSRTVITGGEDKTVRLWDVGTGRELRKFKASTSLGDCAVVGIDKMVGMDEALVLWDMVTGTRTVLAPESRYNSWRGCAVHPGGRWIALPTGNGLYILDLQNPDHIPLVLRDHTDLLTVAFSPCGDLVAASDGSGLISLWNVDDWRPLGRIAAHGSYINDLAFNPAGTVLASVGVDGTVRLWDPSLATTAGSSPTKAVSTAAKTCAAAPDGTWLAVVKSDSTAIHDPASGEVVEKLEFAVGTDLVTVAHGGAHLVVQSLSEIILCEAGDWHITRSLRPFDVKRLLSLSAGGPFVCATGYDDRVVLWNIAEWTPPVFIELHGENLRVSDHPSPRPKQLPRLISRLRTKKSDLAEIAGATIAPSGKWLSVATETGVHIVEPKFGQTVTVLSTSGTPNGASISPDGRRLVVADDETLLIWDTDSWTPLRTIASRSTITAVAWAPDSSVFATVSDDRIVRVFDGRTWECLTELRLDGELTGCAWLGNDHLAVVGAHGVFWFDYSPGTAAAR
jgi:WD40 repeat protein